MTEKRITLQKLERLIPDLAPAQIDRLPLERLPISLPEVWCAQFPAAKREALLALSRRLADPAQRARAETALHDQLRAAARWVMRPDTLTHWLASLDENLIRAERLLQRWREGNGSLRGSGAWSSPASLHSEIELTSGAEVKISDIEQISDTLVLSFNSQKQVVEKYAKLLRSMQKALRKKYPVAELDAAADEAARQLARLSEFMSRFRLLRLNLVNEEMTEQRRQIEAMSRRRLELSSNLESVRHELKAAESWSKRIASGRKRTDPESLRQTIRKLESQQTELTVPISDEQIYDWLNCLVDAVLDDYCRQMAKTQVDRARALFVGLLKYRRRYSASADLTVDDALARSRRDDATRELQDLLHAVFNEHQPDPVTAVQSPDEFNESLEQLKNQMIQELLAPTTPRYAISG